MTVTRRFTGSLAAGAASVLALTLFTPAAAPAAPPGRTPQPAAAAVTVDSLGIPLHDVLLIGGTVAPGPNNKPVLWSAASGEPAHLVAIDPATGKTLSTQDLPDAPGAYAVAATRDGTVYVGGYGTGHFYRRKPGANSPVEDLGRPIPTETYIWRLAVDGAGMIFGSTYPNGKVFSYNPANGAVRDYGQLLPGLQYVRSIAVSGNKIYAGTQPDAHFIEIDKESGAKREIPLPAEVTNPVGVSVYDMNAYDGRVYARFGAATDGRLGVYDIKHGRWSPLIDNVAGLDVSEPGPDGKVYFTKGGHLTGYDPHTGKLTDTGLAFQGRVLNNRGIGWVDLHDRAWPGKTLVGLLWRGEIFRYNPRTGRTELSITDVPGEPIPINAMYIGGSGTVWAGGYLNGGISRVDADTGASTFQRFAQTESVLEADGQVYIGAYPDSRLYRYDPTKTWSSPEYSPGPPGTPDNPAKLVDLHLQDQVRVRGITDAGDSIAYGTMPNATLGGALVILDKATGQSTVHRPVVTDQSIVSLTYSGGLIVGGTSVRGGYSTPPPTQTEAKLFGWDTATDSRAFEITPVPGAEEIGALVVDGSGTLWGLAGGQLFSVDLSTRTVVSRTQLAPSGSGRLVYDAPRNLLYALVSEHLLIRVDLATGESTQVLDHAATTLAVHPDGRLFIGDGPELYRVTVTG